MKAQNQIGPKSGDQGGDRFRSIANQTNALEDQKPVTHALHNISLAAGGPFPNTHNAHHNRAQRQCLNANEASGLKNKSRN